MAQQKENLSAPGVQTHVATAKELAVGRDPAPQSFPTEMEQNEVTVVTLLDMLKRQQDIMQSLTALVVQSAQ